jgi:hypothetical protein
MSIEELEGLMTDTFNIDKETAGKDIRVFLNQMESFFKKTDY